MTTLHSVFLRAMFALALVGTGIAGPQVLPAPAVDARDACLAVPPHAAAQAEPAAIREPATATSVRPMRAVVVAVRD